MIMFPYDEARWASERLKDSEVVEVTLLLPADQAAALEAIAHRQGVTVGQWLRRLIERSCRAIRPCNGSPL